MNLFKYICFSMVLIPLSVQASQVAKQLPKQPKQSIDPNADCPTGMYRSDLEFLKTMSGNRIWLKAIGKIYQVVMAEGESWMVNAFHVPNAPLIADALAPLTLISSKKGSSFSACTYEYMSGVGSGIPLPYSFSIHSEVSSNTLCPDSFKLSSRERDDLYKGKSLKKEKYTINCSQENRGNLPVYKTRFFDSTLSFVVAAKNEEGATVCRYRYNKGLGTGLLTHDIDINIGSENQPQQPKNNNNNRNNNNNNLNQEDQSSGEFYTPPSSPERDDSVSLQQE